MRYLADLLQLYTLSRSLRSSADSHIFCISIRCKKFQGQCAFSYTGTVIWISLAFTVCHAQTLLSFKSQLKTHLFSIYFQAQQLQLCSNPSSSLCMCVYNLVSQLVGAFSPVNHKGLHYAEHKIHSISKLFISQVITPQVICFLSLFIFCRH